MGAGGIRLIQWKSGHFEWGYDLSWSPQFALLGFVGFVVVVGLGIVVMFPFLHRYLVLLCFAHPLSSSAISHPRAYSWAWF